MNNQPRRLSENRTAKTESIACRFLAMQLKLFAGSFLVRFSVIVCFLQLQLILSHGVGLESVDSKIIKPMEDA